MTETTGATCMAGRTWLAVGRQIRIAVPADAAPARDHKSHFKRDSQFAMGIAACPTHTSTPRWARGGGFEGGEEAGD